jgi:hypothetical protein
MDKMNNNSMKSLISLRKSKDGQASAVGTMLAVVVVLTLLSVVTLYYVPEWMKEKEANHMSTVLGEFGDLKKNIDSQIINGDTSVEASSLFVLGTEGIPIFTFITQGTLTIDPYTCFFNIRDEDKNLNITSMGIIKFSSNNNYYQQQSFIYMAGGVIVDQTVGETMRIQPTFTVTNQSGITITTTLISICGEKKVLTGSRTETVKTRLVCSQLKEFAWVGGKNITVTIKSLYVDAWNNFFNSSLSVLNPADYNISKNPDNIVVEIYSVKSLSIRFVSIEAATSR